MYTCVDGSLGLHGGDQTLNLTTKPTFHMNGWMLHKTGLSGVNMPSNTLTGPTQCDLHDFVFCRFCWFQEFVHLVESFSCSPRSLREKNCWSWACGILQLTRPHFFCLRLVSAAVAAYYCIERERKLKSTSDQRLMLRDCGG